MELGEQLLDACLNDIEQVEWIINHYVNKSNNSTNNQNNNQNNQNQNNSKSIILNWKDSKNQYSILHMLTYRNLYEPLELLLSSGANPNILNKNDESPLHWGIRMNSFESVRLLIHYSANVNIQDKSGSTPLHLCCAYGIPELIPLLLESGSYLNVFDKEKKTPLDLAEEKLDIDSYMACAVLLRRHLSLFQSEDISKFNTHPLEYHEGNNIIKLSQSPLRSSSPTQPQFDQQNNYTNNDDNGHSNGIFNKNIKQKVNKPFIAGSTMGVARWEWNRNLSIYTETSPPKTTTKYHINSNPPHYTLPTSTHSRDLDLNDNHQKQQQQHYISNKLQLGNSLSQPLIDDIHTSPRLRDYYSNNSNNNNNNSSPLIPHYTLSIHSPSYMFPISTTTRPSSPTSPLHSNNYFGSSIKPTTIIKQNKTLNNKKFSLKSKIPLYIPFQPSNAKVFDVFLSVEMCSDCHLHNWSLWHNEDRYNGAANECLRVIIHDLLKNVPKIRLFAYKTKILPDKVERIGALEVAITIKISNNKSNQQRNSWVEKLIFSKLKTKSWPNTSKFQSIPSDYVKSILQQYNHESLTSELTNLGSYEFPSRRKLELMFAQWHDRLYGNFRTEEIIEENNSFDENSLSGSYLLQYNSSEISLEEWETSNMKHFLVFDGSDI